MFRLRDLVGVIPGAILLGDLDAKWLNISVDSRTIKPGEIFFSLRGEKYDGHQFINEAIEKGASAIVLEKSSYQSHKSLHHLTKELVQPILLVDNSLSALQLWAHHYHSLFQPVNICITGSNGKTTTKEMIVHLLNSNYHVLKSKGNFNNEIGVPLTLLNLDSHHDILVLEMAARKLGEIKELTNIVKPDIAIITNVCEAHIGLFESRDNIAREKSEIILSLKDKGTAILNRDDSYFDYFKNCSSSYNELISFGFHPEAQLRAANFIQEREKGIHFELFFQGEKHQVFIPLLGRFNVYNCLAAFASGVKMHIPIDEMIHRISTFKTPKMRMENLSFSRGIMVIQDCYNSNPTAVKEALNSIAGISGDRFKVVVLGDMLELGSRSPDYHKEIGKITANLSFDMLIGFGEYGKWIALGAKEQGMAGDRIYCFNKKEKNKLVNKLIKELPQNSIVFLKGSRGMQMEDIVHCWKQEGKTREKSRND